MNYEKELSEIEKELAEVKRELQNIKGILEKKNTNISLINKKLKEKGHLIV